MRRGRVAGRRRLNCQPRLTTHRNRLPSGGPAATPPDPRPQLRDIPPSPALQHNRLNLSFRNRVRAACRIIAKFSGAFPARTRLSSSRKDRIGPGPKGRNSRYPNGLEPPATSFGRLTPGRRRNNGIPLTPGLPPGVPPAALLRSPAAIRRHCFKSGPLPAREPVAHIRPPPPLIFLGRQDVTGLPAHNLQGWLLPAAHGVNGAAAARHIRQVAQLRHSGGR